MGACSGKNKEDKEEELLKAKQRREEEKLAKERRPFRTNQSNRTLSNSRVIHLNWDGNKIPITFAKPPDKTDPENNNIPLSTDFKTTEVKTNLNGNKSLLSNFTDNNFDNDLKLPNVEIPPIKNGSTVNLQVIKETSNLSVNRITTPMPPLADSKSMASPSTGQLLVLERSYTNGALVPTAGSFMQIS